MNSPEELIYLARNKKSLVWKDNFLELAVMDLALHKFKKYELVALRLLGTETASNLVKLTSVSLDTLQNNLNHPEYKHYQTKKKKGGSRLINAPCGELKKIQKRLNYYLQGYYLCLKPKEVHGFVLLPPTNQLRSNIVANAQDHVGTVRAGSRAGGRCARRRATRRHSGRGKPTERLGCIGDPAPGTPAGPAAATSGAAHVVAMIPYGGSGAGPSGLELEQGWGSEPDTGLAPPPAWLMWASATHGRAVVQPRWAVRLRGSPPKCER